LLPFGHFLARLFDALELLLPLDELVLALSCHIPPVFFGFTLPPMPVYFAGAKKPRSLYYRLWGGATAKTKSESVVPIDLSAADVKN
jgi:hypothetical protein